MKISELHKLKQINKFVVIDDELKEYFDNKSKSRNKNHGFGKVKKGRNKAHFN